MKQLNETITPTSPDFNVFSYSICNIHTGDVTDWSTDPTTGITEYERPTAIYVVS